ncbi:trigger factor [Desulfohalobiaceae bacterium Ax17]|uniref:trigger factor n=1 Tax=Desulfovulcanus ferrireducens TaxID=2831190 RepID=UPI00207BAF9B|nr:trigger factor [Desulfovulcanus ferrireducens]MBT8764107.1 trigger factor [Desulfovulcanus ferrireducens]
MDYKVEELSSVKRKVNVQVPIEEVNAAIAATVALYRKDADIKGFRKGKVPSSIIEGRFKKQIYNEATTDLINLHINEILNEMKLVPLSRIDVDAKELVKGQEFNYSFSFEVAPEFELPEYKGLEVEEEEVEVNKEEVEAVIQRLRERLAEFIIVEEDRHPKEGDAVVIDFEAYKDGEPIEGVKAENFQMTLGEGGALPEFEEIVMGLKPGQSGEGEVQLPEDFINKELAGQKVLMKVTLHNIKEKKLPDIDDELAQKAGGYDSIEKLREAIEKSYVATRKELTKSVAQKKLLDELKAKVDFELPESMVKSHIDQKIAELRDKLERQGKSFDSLGKSMEELEKEFRPEAEEIVKSQIFLLAVAQKEELTVKPEELDAQLQKIAYATGQDFATLKNFYEQNNLMIALKDKVLADKAMELIYENAKIKLVPPVKDEEGEEPSKESESEE